MPAAHKSAVVILSTDLEACALSKKAAEASKTTRDALLKVKRLKRGPVETVSNPSAGLVQPESPQTKVQQLVTALNTPSLAQKAKLRAISALRRILSTDDLPFEAAIQAGAGACLIKPLLLRQQSAIDLKIIFEAAWAVTNLAAGPRECVEAVLPAAPLLILLLRTHSSSHIAEQSAWALGKSFVQCLVRLRLLSKAESLPTCIMYTVMSHMRGSLQLDESMPQQDGNLAGESPEIRARLQANGAVRPLLQLVLAGTDQPGLRVLSTACTAAWALSNLLQDSSTVAREVFAVPGAAQGLVQLLNSTTSPELLLEVAWVLCHASFSQADVNRLVHLGLLKAVIRQSSLCLQAGPTSTEGEHTQLPLLRPLLRITANVAALGGRDAAAELLLPPLCAEAVNLVHYCLTNREAGLQAEAAWLCTNMAAMPDRPKGEEGRSHRGQDALRQLMPVLEHITLRGDSLAQREAAHAMANLTAVGTS
ncbi:TPA: hypothetical protein ACH3X3_013822 [Trebouxia sp. C0006]